jgi:hypothetical protein
MYLILIANKTNKTVSVETCLMYHCLAMTAHSYSTVAAFSHQAAILQRQLVCFL